jgi:NTE family protein
MRRSDLLEPNNLRLVFSALDYFRDFVVAAREDVRLFSRMARALSPWEAPESENIVERVFPPLRPLRVPALEGKRIALVASGGSGATASLCGIRRAFEEAELEVVTLSACSGSMLFGALWAAGFDAEQMAQFWLRLPARDYLDPDYRALLQAGLHGFRRFGGLIRGDALERTYERCLGPMKLGETKIGLSAVVWNIDQNRVEYLGTRSTPELTVARAVRTAVAIPIFFEPVQLGEHLYGDGGIVDVFPVEPLFADEPLDVVFGVNCYLPENFSGEDVTGWREKSFAILRASGQLRYGVFFELAREHARTLGKRLILLTPVPYSEVRGAQFYDSFLDRRNWQRYMLQGYECTRAKLESIAEHGI